ncbi:hypothetical protein [Parapedobacter tibetensis]|uniref:hypothetical protein n=1 Tax=Parapedobacter tibetensis TaxID=2972951 RepID=UPI00214DB06C|nr:hypothetical protein [Parapedobacter tibetensis]
MITVIVTYTVKESYVSKNKENIAAFLEDFNRLDAERFGYTIYQKENKNTFVHISEYKDEIIQKELLNIPSFLSFQQQRDQNLEVEPTIEMLAIAGSSGATAKKY